MARVHRNLTITLDEEIARWARVEAARRDTSVSQLIATMLRERMLGSDDEDQHPMQFGANTGIAEKTVRNRVGCAKTMLRQSLDDYSLSRQPGRHEPA